MKPQKARYFQLLELLSHHRVDFIVVGGVAAILEGVPITTLDLDIVYDRSPTNLERLMEVLQAVEASYRDPAGRHIVPTVEKLATIRVNLLHTSGTIRRVGFDSGRRLRAIARLDKGQ